MKPSLNLLFLIIILLFSNCSREKKSDLEIKLKPEDEKEVTSLGKALYKNISSKNHDSVIIIGKQFIKYMQQKPYLKNGIYAVNDEMGKAYLALKKHDSAVLAYKKSIKFFEQEPGAIEELSNQYINTIIGLINIDKRTENYDNAIKVLYRGLINLNGEKPKLRSRLFNELGYVYWYMKDINYAEKMFRKSLLIPEKSEFTKNANYMGLGDVFFSKNLDSAYFYYKKASSYFKKKIDKGNYYTNIINISQVLIRKGEVIEAEKLLLEAENHFIKSGSKYDIGRVYLGLAKVAMYNKNIDNEFKYLEQARPFLEKNGGIVNLHKLYLQFSKFYTKTGDLIKQKHYANKANQIKDSIYNPNKRSLINIYKINHLYELNELKVQTQKKQISIQSKQKKWLIIGVLILLFLIIILYILYLQRIKTQKALLKNQEELSAQKVSTLLQNQKVRSMQSHIEGQKKERERIAKDLHDSISGNLAAIKMKLTDIKENQSKDIDLIISNIDKTYNQVRSISHNLTPQEVVEYNFINVLNQLILLYQSENLKLTIEVFPEEELNLVNNSIQIEIYRILQELITNIVKHANATKGLINITLHDDYLNLIIEDNGIGIDIRKKEKGIGLKNISSRVKSLNGTIELDSGLNKGVTVNINIPTPT
ncbi:sensor histidine kinase [Tenacibaculum sp. S7007]|uniref:histidine kinase n=1 Tax=Tenacibaculum pelagium TaxID=2759527 RepID=A0A839AQG3_9FLAO|nr:sensor histidine kinase [Tenacibaculum pelagium]MBA6157333.1 sensor histidine kinase [Tenacibaculum pelagium]